MKKAQQKRTDSLYRQHVSALKRQGKAEASIDSYSRAVRRITDFFDAPPDILTQPQLEAYFESLVSTHSWSTVKVDRNGFQARVEERLGVGRDHQAADGETPAQCADIQRGRATP